MLIILERFKLEAPLENPTKPNRLVIFADNQAANYSTKAPKQQSGQFYLKIIVDLTNKLRQIDIEPEVRWIPAHIGVFGNEIADKLAKEATGWRENALPIDPGPPASHEKSLKSAVKRTLKAWIKNKWIEKWKSEKSGRKLFNLHEQKGKLINDPKLFYQNKHRALTSLAIQLRLGKTGFKEHLFSFGAAESPRCSCGEGNENINHVIMMCPELQELRQEIWQGRQAGNIAEVLNDPQSLHQAARFVLRSNKLKQFRFVPQDVSQESAPKETHTAVN
jgi:hypothetical protein